MKKKKLYRARIYIGDDTNGKHINKWVSGHTRSELEANRQKVIEQYIGGRAVNDKLTFGQIAVEWYETRKKPTMSDAGCSLYRSVMNTHVLPALGERRMTSIRQVDLQKTLNSLSGKSYMLISATRIILESVCKAAYRDGIILRDPSVDLISPPHSQIKQKRLLTEEERTSIEELAQDRPWLAILYYTGMRGGEMRALKWDCVDLKKRIIHIHDAAGEKAGSTTGGKTESAIRDVPISDQLFDILKRFAGMPNIYITGVPWSAKHLREHFLALKLPKDITTHYLRHNFITMCWESNVDALITARIVGHKNIGTTLNVYTHANATRYPDIVSKVFSKDGCTTVAQVK